MALTPEEMTVLIANYRLMRSRMSKNYTATADTVESPDIEKGRQAREPKSENLKPQIKCLQN